MENEKNINLTEETAAEPAVEKAPDEEVAAEVVEEFPIEENTAEIIEESPIEENTAEVTEESPIEENTAEVTEEPQGGKSLAIGSLILGICAIFFSFSVVLSFICLIAAIIGIVLARKSKKNGYSGGLATGGLVTSIIGLILSGILTLICSLYCVSCVGCFGCASYLASSPEFNEYVESGQFESEFYEYMEDYMSEIDYN